MSEEKLSPNEKAIINRRNYAAYVANLEATNTKFPINQFGDANISLVAKTCGFKRTAFQIKESFLSKAIQSDIDRIGTEVQSVEKKESYLEGKAKTSAMHASQREKELERTTAEIEKLREEIKLLQYENFVLKQKEDENIERQEMMIESGRRVFI
jgi:septal ring factor EnvC (AmiA/AmiB activator)